MDHFFSLTKLVKNKIGDFLDIFALFSTKMLHSKNNKKNKIKCK